MDMKQLKKKLLKQVGEPCKEYNRFCFTCIVWEAYKTLEETFKI